MKKIIKFISILSILSIVLFSGQCLPISLAKPTHRLALKLDANELEIEQKYLTNYIMRLSTDKGQGDLSILKRNTQILDFVAFSDVEIKTDGFEYNVDFKNLNIQNIGSLLKSETTKIDLTQNVINAGGDWKNSSIDITGGSLIDFIAHTGSGLKHDDENLALVLNLLTLAESTLSIADKATLGNKTKDEKIKKLKKVVGQIKTLKTYGESLSMYYTFSKVLVDSILVNAVALGGLDDKGEPVDQNLLSFYHKFKTVVEITDRLNAVVSSGSKFIKEKTETETQSLSSQYKKALLETKDKLSETSSKTIATLYKEKELKGEDKFEVVSKYMIQPAYNVISEFKKVLASQLEEAKRNNDLIKVDKLKKDILVLTAGKSFFQLVGLVLDSRKLGELIKNDPKKAPEVIIPIFWDMSGAVLTMFLSDEKLIYNSLNEKVSQIISDSAKVAENSASKQVHYKAFLLGKEAGNKFIPLVWDFIFAPSAINVTIIDGKLSQFGEMKTLTTIEPFLSDGIHAADGSVLSITNETNKDVYYYAKKEEVVRISTRLHRPKLFAETSPWMTNTNMVPGPIYSVRLSLSESHATKSIFCAKNLIGFRQYSNHLLINEQALNIFPSVCDSGTLGIAALNNNEHHWFEEKDQYLFNNIAEYNSFWNNHFVTIYTEQILGRETDIKVPSYLKLQSLGNDDQAIAILGVKAEEAFGKTISLNISGLDMADKNWFIHVLPLIEVNDIQINGENTTVFIDGLSKISAQFNIDISTETHLEKDPIETYIWDFGDGSGSDLKYIEGNSTVSALHNFDIEGQYTVTLTIQTVSGQEVTKSQIIDIQHPPISAPQNLSAISTDNSIKLTWGAVSNAAMYHLYYSTSPEFSEIATVHDEIYLGDVETPFYTLSGLNNDQVYYLKLTAEDIGGGESLYSDTVSATPKKKSAISISSGANHLCTLGNTGIACFGNDSYGKSTPPILINPTQVSAGGKHSCAIDDTGVVCWGNDSSGKSTPPALINPTQVSAGGDHSCAMDDTGVVCWGDNYYGKSTPPALINPTQVSAGGNHSCAMDDTGVVCWGRNEYYGQSTPPILINPTQISAGDSHSCAMDDTGVVCWGNDTSGQSTPPILINPTQISAGGYHSCAIDDTGVVCWGYNGEGQSNPPTLINPTQVSVGRSHSCAMDDTGVVCWGNNYQGQILVPLINPVQLSVASINTCVLTDTGVVCWGSNYFGESTPPILINPTQISAGDSHSCAMDDTGVVCWGNNYSGQSTPPILINPTQISVGEAHSCAIDDTGVVCWGYNDEGQSNPPALINPTQVSAGGNHSCAMDDTGVVCWGDNYYGQSTPPALINPTQVSAGGNHSCAMDDTGVVCWGDNYYYGQSTPPVLINPTQVSTGERHSCAIDDTGVVCWGNDSSGQSNPPILINPTQISAGDSHSCAMDDTGLVCWGIYKYHTLSYILKPFYGLF